MSKLAILTGGSRGLGAALCRLYADQGYELLEFSRSGTAPYTVRVDLSRPDAADKLFASALAPHAARRYDEIIVINNAGMLHPIGPTARKAAADVIANASANFTAAIVFITRVIAAFQSHDCRKTIINISSGAALNNYAGWSLYCAAKAGTEHFVRCVAAEQQREAHPFVLLNLGPGVIDTEMQAQIRSTDRSEFPTVQRFLDLHADGALRTPAEVAAFVARVAAGNHASGSRVDISTGG
jgi:benzil reductase ((S)-benzoin forming)